jgi:hypothetical protein
MAKQEYQKKENLNGSLIRKSGPTPNWNIIGIKFRRRISLKPTAVLLHPFLSGVANR